MNEEHSSRPTWTIALILLAVFVCVIAAVSWKVLVAKPYYFRDPAQTGDSTAYDRVMNPEPETSLNFTGVLESITMRTNESDIVVQMPIVPRQDEYSDGDLYEYHHLNHNDAFESEEGRIWIDHIAVAYGEFPPDEMNNHSVRLPARFFNADMRELSEDEILEIMPDQQDRDLSFEGVFPTVSLFLRGEFSAEAEIMNVSAFDARMLQPLSRGYSMFRNSVENLERSWRIHFDPKLWHEAPIELVVDIVLGPPEIIEFPAEIGAKAMLSDGEIMLLAKAENMKGDSRFRSDNTITAHLSPTTRNSDSPRTELFFAIDPKAHQATFVFHAFDSQGTNLFPTGSSGSGLYFGRSSGTGGDFFMNKEVEGKPEEIKTIRIDYYSNRKRLIFRIPQIPGLPEANENIENLFDIYIPFIRVNRVSEFRQIVRELTQLEFKGSSPANTAFVGPIVFEDITVKELVDEYAKLYGPTYGAQIDQENLTIEFLDMSLKARALRLWEEVKSKFQ